MLCVAGAIGARYLWSRRAPAQQPTVAVALTREPAVAKKAAAAPSQRVYPPERQFKSPAERQELFKRLGLHYSPTISFSEACQAFTKLSKEDYLPYQRNPLLYEKLAAKYGPWLDKHHVAPVYIQWISDEIGYGVFAQERIEAGELIAEYVGRVIPRATVSTWSWKYPSSGTFKGHPVPASLTGEQYANETRFINDGDVANVETKFVFHNGLWHLLYVAKQGIEPGEELLISYGPRYWRSRQKIALGKKPTR